MVCFLQLSTQVISHNNRGKGSSETDRLSFLLKTDINSIRPKQVFLQYNYSKKMLKIDSYNTNM